MVRAGGGRAAGDPGELSPVQIADVEPKAQVPGRQAQAGAGGGLERTREMTRTGNEKIVVELWERTDGDWELHIMAAPMVFGTREEAVTVIHKTGDLRRMLNLMSTMLQA